MSKRSERRRRALATAPVPTPSLTPASAFERFTPHPRISAWNPAGTWTEVTIAQIEATKRAAERGFTEDWADLTRRMLNDGHILSTYTTYVGAIASGRREVTAAAVLPHQEESAKLQAADCEAMLESLPNIERSIAELIDADFTGYAVQEIIYESRGDWVWPTELVWIHPDRIRFSDRFEPYIWDRGRAAARARELGFALDTNADMLGMPLVPSKYLVHVPRLVPNYPMLSGLLISCIGPWYTKIYANRFWLSGAESAGNPRILGKLAEQATAAAREELYQALASLSGDSVGVVSGGTTVEILDPKAQGAGSIFDTITKTQNAEISKIVLGSTLNVEVGDAGGNRSLGESQADMTMAPRWGRSSALVSNTIEEMLFRPFLEFNRERYGGQIFVPKLAIHIVEDVPEIDQPVIDAGACTYDELRRSRKLAPLGPAKGGDNLIPKAEAAAAFSAGGSGAEVPFSRSTLATSMRMLSTEARKSTSARRATGTPTTTR